MSEVGKATSQDPEYRGLGGRFGVISRLRLGRTALAVGGVELALGAASVLIGSPDPLIIGTAGTAWVSGEVLYTLYNNRNQPHDQIPGTLAPCVSREDPDPSSTSVDI